MSDEKYVTFKRAALDNLLVAAANEGLTPKLGEMLNNFVSEILPDAVVIRRQDVFAPPALDAYANSIMSAVLIIQSTDEDFSIEESRRLKEIADYFHDQAAQSWQTDRKLPD